jgi:hypothetical protein
MNQPMPPVSPFGPVVRLPAAPNPMGSAAQVASLYGPQGQGIMPAGYQAAPGMGVAHVANPGPAAAPQAGSPQQLVSMLRESLYPSQREWAAEKLAALDWKTNEMAVQALVQGAREDPAATVRAGCVRALGQMKANTMPVVTTLQGLKNDTDPRVRTEVEQALGVLAPGGSAPMPSPVQPVGAVCPAPVPVPASGAGSSLPALPPISGSH